LPSGASNLWGRSELSQAAIGSSSWPSTKITKWIEVRHAVKVTSEGEAKFMQDITHYFGLPNTIITDLGTAFTGSTFWHFC
jgi:hypothetical protein